MPVAAGNTIAVDAARDTLYETVVALDAAVFEAFNRCADPEQLDRHAGYFASQVEFYHDTGGVTRTRKAMIANVRKNVCGKIRRERVTDTLEVFPVENFGAIARGEHRFCRLDSEGCESRADFVIVWRRDDDQWRITRALSFNHRPNQSDTGN